MGVDPRSMSSPTGKAPGVPKPPAPAETIDLKVLGLDLDTADDRTRADAADKLAAASAQLRRARSNRLPTTQKATPTQARTAELDANPTLVWTGTHYQRVI